MIPGFGRTGFGRDEIYPDLLSIYRHGITSRFLRNMKFLHVPPEMKRSNTEPGVVDGCTGFSILPSGSQTWRAGKSPHFFR